MSTTDLPPGYLGAEARIDRGPSRELIEAGYALELADAPFLHRGLAMADLAHVIALYEGGVVSQQDAAQLCQEILRHLDLRPDEFPYDPVYGDAYNSRERCLERVLGATAGWLHTGRTRREAGRIAFRLGLRTLLIDTHDAVASLCTALTDGAATHAETLWRDTTYLQPAQPSTFGHYLLAFAEEASRHLDRLRAVVTWVDRSPAGAGGVAGTRVPVSRHRIAELLGFSGPAANLRDAMWSGDGLIDVAVCAAHIAITCDRIAEDMEIFASPEFGYVTLDGSVCRASVMMPQKRNPYALAVVRATANDLLGKATAAMATQRTPSARTDNWLLSYGASAASATAAARIARLTALVMRTMRVDRVRMAAQAGADFTCTTDLTDQLVLTFGIDYRTAYRLTGRAVALAEAAGHRELLPDHLVAAAGEQGFAGLDLERMDLAAVCDPARIVSTRQALGGAAPEAVALGVADMRQRLARLTAEAEAVRRRHAQAERTLQDMAKRLAS